MALETGGCNGVCEVSKAELEGKSVSDVVAQEDEQRSGECNGIACGEAGVVGGAAKDDVDGSYVFVNGESDELNERDLDVDDKVDLDGSKMDEPVVESGDLSEGDLGENGKVEIRATEVEGSAVETSALAPTVDAKVQEISSEYKESSDHNEKKGDLLSSVEEPSHEHREKGKLKLENGHSRNETDASNLDLVVETTKIQEESSMSDMIEEHYVPESVPEIENESSMSDMIEEHYVPESVPEIEDEVSCKVQASEESLGEVLCHHDGSNGEVVNGKVDVNGKVEEQEDGESLVATPSEIKDKESETVVTETAGAASPPLLNGEEVMASSADEVVPAEEQSETILAATDVSLENEEALVSFIPAEEQAEIMVVERSGLELLPLMNEEAPITSNSAEEIPAVEKSAHPRIEQESETQSSMELGAEEKSDENGEAKPILTVDEVKSKVDESNVAQEMSERLPSGPVETPEAGGEATEVLVDITESSSTCPMDDEGSVKEVMSVGDNANSELKVGKESAECMEDASASSTNDVESRTVMEETTIEDKIHTSNPINGMESEPEAAIDSLKVQNCVAASPDMETRLEESGEDASAIPGNDTAPVTEDSPQPVETSKDAFIPSVDDGKESEVGSGPVEHGENVADSTEESQSENKDDSDKLASAEDNATEKGSENEVLLAPVDDPGSLSLPGQKVDTDLKHLQFYMVRVPRFSDEKLKMQIQHAQQEVDEKTGSRDSIRVAMQKQKGICAEYWQKVEDARKEERAAKDVVASKRQEIDSIQSILSKLKNATSISDIDNRIHKLQHRINHETNTLKEEKLLIREMNQLKQSREHLSSSLASEEELKEAFEKQEQMETRLKHLREELDALRKDILRAEGNTKSAKIRYEDQCGSLRDLQNKFKAADDLRQEAYTNLRNLKKESFVKNEYFYSYKDDVKIATNYAFSGDREALHSHCTNQIEKVMELWNKNDEFRHQYVKANMPSTVRRFRTVDGRSLGPDEEPTVIRNPIEQKENIISPSVSKNNTPALATERKQEKSDPPLLAAKLNSADGPTAAQKSQPQKPKKVASPAPREEVSNRESDKEEAEKERKQKIEEEEQARKAEELARKEEELRKEEAAKMKEQLRLEQIAKAKEAEERKKRKAEKAQAKAEMKAQKEAELREKKREKKERKKERKATLTTTDTVGEAEDLAPVAEIPPESVQEQSEKMVNVPSKRPSRPRAPTKEYNKVKPLPAPLRNRGKRKIQTWMWVLLTALVVLALFMGGNYISFPKFGLRDVSF